MNKILGHKLYKLYYNFLVKKSYIFQIFTYIIRFIFDFLNVSDNVILVEILSYA